MLRCLYHVRPNPRLTTNPEMDVMNDDEPAGHRTVLSQLAHVRLSARGWQKAQLAVLGALALLAVLQSRTTSHAPSAVQAASGLLLLLAAGVACWAALLVGRVAEPAPSHNTPAAQVHDGEEAKLRQISRRLRRGYLLTCIAITLAALATTSLWWLPPA